MIVRHHELFGSIVLVLVFASTWFLTGVLRQAAIRRHWLDIPNHRSSHSAPVPRGGGLSFVLVITFAAFFMECLFVPAAVSALEIVIAGVPLAIISWIDDRSHVPVRWRLLVQTLSAVSVSWLMLRHVSLPIHVWAFPGAILVLSVALVWWTNLFNFMDGIDGIAATEGIAISVSVFFIVAGDQGATALAFFSVAVAASVCGFVIWNWPPARIFMGDVGSAWLGLTTGAVLVWMAVDTRAGVTASIILSSAFWIDATVTLTRRALRGEAVYVAHRSHLYQRLARSMKGHRPVTLLYGGITLFWLFPWAYCVTRSMVNPVFASICSLTPLISMAILLGAGKREEVSSL